jgi:hypothetical protein
MFPAKLLYPGKALTEVQHVGIYPWLSIHDHDGAVLDNSAHARPDFLEQRDQGTCSFLYFFFREVVFMIHHATGGLEG